MDIIIRCEYTGHVHKPTFILYKVSNNNNMMTDRSTLRNKIAGKMFKQSERAETLYVTRKGSSVAGDDDNEKQQCSGLQLLQVLSLLFHKSKNVGFCSSYFFHKACHYYTTTVCDAMP